MNHRVWILAVIGCCVTPSVTAAVTPPTCTGACALTFFNTTVSQICDYVDVSITGAIGSGGSVVGTSVFTAASDMETAAVLMGLVVPGSTGTLRMYWAGPRDYFLAGTANGVSATGQLSSDYGVLLTNGTTCPLGLNDSTTTPLRHLVGQPDAGGVVGFGYYPLTTDVFSAVSHTGWLKQGEYQNQDLFAHEVTPKEYFAGGYHNLIASTPTVYSPAVRTFVVTNSPLPPTADDAANRSYVMLSMPTVVPGTAVYGTTYVRYDSDIVKAAYHAGMCSLGQQVGLWIHWIGVRPVFYPSWLQPDAASSSSDVADQAIYLSRSAVSPHVVPGVVPVDVTVYSLQQGMIQGTGVYTYYSDILLASWHAGLTNMDHDHQRIYIYDLGVQQYFIGSSRLSVISTGMNTPYLGYTVSSFLVSPTSRINNATARFVTLQFSYTPYGGMSFGTGFYRWDSDAAAAAFHGGWLKAGETKQLWIVPLGIRPAFYGSTMRGVNTQGGSTPDIAFTFSTVGPDVPAAYSDPDGSYLVNLTSSGPGTACGLGYYAYTSDLAAAAVHAGLLQPQETATLRVSPIGDRQIFLSARLWSISSVYAEQLMPAFQLSHPEVHIIGTPREMRDVSAGPTPFNITFDNNYATQTFGIGVYAGASDVKMSAFLDGLLNIGERREIWVHPLPVRPLFYPSARYMEEYSGGVAGGTDYSFGFVLAPSSITPAAVALAGQNIIEASVMSTASPNTQLSGVVLYSRYSDVGRAAYHAGILRDIGVRQTVYIHLFPTMVSSIYGCTNNSITSYGIAWGGADYAFRVSGSTTPLPLIDPLNFSAVLMHTSMSTGIVGTNYYTMWSDVARAAHHSRLMHWGETKRVWILQLPNWMTNFYASTSGSSASSSYFGPMTAFLVTLTPSDVSWPDENALKVTTILNKQVSNAMCSGAGTYMDQSDITVAAFHNNIIPAYDVLTTFYVFKTTEYRALAGAINRGIRCTSTYSSAGFILSVNATRPVSYEDPMLIQVATITIAPSSRFSSCYGTTYFWMQSYLDCAAVHQNIATYGETVTIYVYHLGIISSYYGSRGGGGYLSSTLSYSDYGFSVGLDNVTEPPMITIPPSMVITLREYPIGEPLVGFGWYSQTTSITAAAFHAGLIKYNETKRIYVTECYKDRLYSATSFGLTSGFQNTLNWWWAWPGYTFPSIVISLDPAMPDIVSSPTPYGLLTPVSIMAYIEGHTLFSVNTDVTEAALTMNLIRMNETKMIYVNVALGLPALPRCGRYNYGGHSTPQTSYYGVQVPSFYLTEVVDATASAFTFPTGGVPMNITAYRPRQYDDWGSTQGTDVYTVNSDLCLAAVHAGLLKWGETQVIYAFYFSAFSGYYASSRNGVTTNAYPYSIDGWMLSLSPTAPTLPDATNFPFVMYQQAAPQSSGTLTGTGRYTIDSDVGLAAVHAGFYRWGDAPVQLWLKRQTSMAMFLSATSNGVRSQPSTFTSDAFVLSTSSAALPTCLSSSSYFYWPLPKGSISRSDGVYADATMSAHFHYSSEATRSIRFAGLTAAWGYGERRTVKMSFTTGTTTYGAYTVNGVTTTNLGSVYASMFQVTMDATCDASFTFPTQGAVAATGTLCEGGSTCVNTLFPSGTSTAAGTVAGPFVVVGDTNGGLYGTTYYSKTGLIPEAAVVHAGLLRAGEVGVFYATWLGAWSGRFYSAYNNGVQTNGLTTGDYAVAFSKSNAAVTTTAGITPFNCTAMFTGNTPTGYRVFAGTYGVEYAAQLMELVEVGYGWRMLYIHDVASRSNFYPNQVNNRRSSYTYGGSQIAYSITDSTTVPTDVGIPLRVTVTYPNYNVFHGNQPTCTGTQYWRIDSNVVCSAIVDGFLTAMPSNQGSLGNDVVTLYIWDTPNPGRYYATARNGWSSDRDSSSAMIGFSLTTTTTPPVLSSTYTRVEVSGEMTGPRGSSGTSAVYGIRDYYSLDSTFISYAAMHQGFIRVGDPASIQTVYVQTMGNKASIHSVFLNGLQSNSNSGWGNGNYPVFALTLDPITDPKVPDSNGPYVTPYIIFPSFYDRTGSTVQGSSFYSTSSDVAQTAKHRGFYRMEARCPTR